jgi:hypothetical protein
VKSTIEKTVTNANTSVAVRPATVHYVQHNEGGETLTDALIDVGVVALIVGITGWVLASRGPTEPGARGTEKVYGIKPGIRTAALLAGVLCAAIPIYLRHDLRSPEDWVMAGVFICAAICGFWLGTGAVVVNENGIRKKGLWRSTMISWTEVREIVIQQRLNVITLHAGRRQIRIDERFAPRDRLVAEIVDRTRLTPRQVG